MAQQTIGIIGAGQLALMMFEASLRLPLEVRVLGADPQDPAVRVMSRAVVGDHRDRDFLDAMRDLQNAYDLALISHHAVQFLQ